jgi:hypothetical protein
MLFSTNVNYLTGRLLNWSQESVNMVDLLRCKRLTFVRMVGSSHWEELRYKSIVPLYGEDSTLIPGPYEYPVICRRSGARLLILSEHSDIVDYIIEEEFKDIFSPRLRHMNVAVDRLVKAITLKPTIYVLTYAHARVPAFGSNLRLITLYGEDLGQASLFHHMLKELTFASCGLRLAAKPKEVVRLSADGAVSFLPANKQRLDHVEQILGFIRREGYLPDPDDEPLFKQSGEKAHD